MGMGGGAKGKGGKAKGPPKAGGCEQDVSEAHVSCMHLERETEGPEGRDRNKGFKGNPSLCILN
jgi:hypothetical protein